jgi:hypothetical protein
MMPRASRTTRRIGVALAVTAGGDAFVLDFHDGTTGTHDAYVQHYTPGSPAGTWTQELVLSKPNATSLGQTASYLAVSDRGNAAAAFSTGGTAAYTAATRSGTTWTQPPQASFSVNQIAVSVNDAGDVLIGYEDQGTVPHAYQYDATSMAWSTTAATLNTETEGSRNGSCPLTVKVASTGDATLARCYSSSPQTLESYAFTKGTKTWAAATAIPLTGYSFLGSFVFDSAGSGLAAFGDSATNSTSTASVVTSSYETATGWSAPSAPLGATPTGVPHAFISPNGRGWVARVDNQSTFKVEKVR